VSRYTIIGQGIAGSLLAWALEKRGIEFRIIDAGDPQSASRLSTGVLNPVTGRRLAVSWMADEMIATAWEAYAAMEHVLGITCMHPGPILKLFSDVREENEWTSRVSPEHPFIKDIVTIEEPSFHPSRGVVIHGGGWIEQDRLLQALRARWKAKGILIEDTMEILSTPLDDEITVYCDGVGALSGTAFHPLRLVPSKGEYITIRAPGVPRDRIIGSRYVLVPRAGREDDAFSFGSTYDRDDHSPEPTSAARVDLEMRLKKLLRVPFEITGHYAGIRPSTYDRRPLMGRHPQDPNRVLFNGLGSKGALMAPWLAEHLVAHLEGGVPLNAACWWLR
jgi:glycine/D-amino acid oxidase-like deaminating enzyme